MGTNTHHDKLDEAIRGDYALKTSPSPTIGAGRIPPSVGRVVWYWSTTVVPGAQPWRADICHVNEDGTVNLNVHTSTGDPFAALGVTFYQGDDEEGRDIRRPCATWMPYQKGQAAKTEAAEQRAQQAKQVWWDPELGQLWPALDLQRELMAEQVRQLRLQNDQVEAQFKAAQEEAERRRIESEKVRAQWDAEVAAETAAKGAGSQQLPEVPGMPPHQVRMRFERDELNVRIMKAEQFMGTPTFTDLDETERDLLIDQVEAMRTYREILQTRIALFQEAQDNA